MQGESRVRVREYVTAHVVQWIFAERLAGHSVARIARALNEAGVPCPSAADPGRNPHRTGTAWALGTVATILGNPRYTGRQVWNRQRTDSQLADPANTSLGHRQVQRWNLPDGWVISARPAHPALLSEADFITAQDISAARGPLPMPNQRRTARSGPAEERLHPGRSHPAAPARPAPAPDRARAGGRAAKTHTSRSRRPAWLDGVSGLLNASQQIGSALGLAILSAVAITRTNGLIAAHASRVAASDAGYHRALLVGSILMAVAALIAMRIGNTWAAAPLVMVSTDNAPEPFSRDRHDKLNRTR
jgi:Recombinase